MANTEIIAISVILTTPWAVVIAYLVTQKKRSTKYFKLLQERYSLKAENNGNQIRTITGHYRGKPIKIESVEPAGSKYCTQLTVECENPNSFEFKLEKKKKSANHENSNGSDLFSDNSFNDMFIVQTNNMEKLKSMLDFNSRFKLEQAMNLGFNGEIKLEGNTISYTEPGLLKNEHEVMRLELILHEMCDMADTLKGN